MKLFLAQILKKQIQSTLCLIGGSALSVCFLGIAQQSLAQEPTYEILMQTGTVLPDGGYPINRAVTGFGMYPKVNDSGTVLFSSESGTTQRALWKFTPQGRERLAVAGVTTFLDFQGQPAALSLSRSCRIPEYDGWLGTSGDVLLATAIESASRAPAVCPSVGGSHGLVLFPASGSGPRAVSMSGDPLPQDPQFTHQYSVASGAPFVDPRNSFRFGPGFAGSGGSEIFHYQTVAVQGGSNYRYLDSVASVANPAGNLVFRTGAVIANAPDYELADDYVSYSQFNGEWRKFSHNGRYFIAQGSIRNRSNQSVALALLAGDVTEPGVYQAVVIFERLTQYTRNGAIESGYFSRVSGWDINDSGEVMLVAATVPNSYTPKYVFRGSLQADRTYRLDVVLSDGERPLPDEPGRLQIGVPIGFNSASYALLNSGEIVVASPICEQCGSQEEISGSALIVVPRGQAPRVLLDSMRAANPALPDASGFDASLFVMASHPEGGVLLGLPGGGVRYRAGQLRWAYRLGQTLENFFQMGQPTSVHFENNGNILFEETSSIANGAMFATYFGSDNQLHFVANNLQSFATRRTFSDGVTRDFSLVSTQGSGASTLPYNLVGPGSHSNGGQWVVRANVRDPITNVWTRAIIRVTLGAQATRPGDFNLDGSVSVQDLFDFLNAWFALLPSADFNHDGGVTVQDLFDFLNAWFEG